MGRRHGLREKRLSFRDATGKDATAWAAIWAGFTWSAGPVVVEATGPWGQSKVWASSEAEGKRVLRHALTNAGWDPDDPSQGDWYVRTTSSSRLGKPGTYRLGEDRYGPRVSARDGSDGSPYPP